MTDRNPRSGPGRSFFDIFRNKYRYPTLAVLLPSHNNIGPVIRGLEETGIPAKEVTRDFDFSETGSVRVSTMHGAKGLDFPVVLLFLPTVFAFGGADEERKREQERNLLYVAMTRAMDSLNVFLLVPEGGFDGEGTLRFVAEAFEASGIAPERV